MVAHQTYILMSSSKAKTDVVGVVIHVIVAAAAVAQLTFQAEPWSILAWVDGVIGAYALGVALELSWKI